VLGSHSYRQPVTLDHVLWARRAGVERSLDPIARSVLLALATYASRTGAAWPSARTLADDLGLHRETVRERLATLAELRPALFASVTRPAGRRAAIFQFPAVDTVVDCVYGEPEEVSDPVDTVHDCNKVLLLSQSRPVDTVQVSVDTVHDCVYGEPEEVSDPVDTVHDCNKVLLLSQSRPVDTVQVSVDTVLSPVDTVHDCPKYLSNTEVRAHAHAHARPDTLAHARGADPDPDAWRAGQARGHCAECGHVWAGHTVEQGCCFRCGCRARP